MAFCKPRSYAKSIILELVNSDSLKRVPSDTLLDKGGERLNVVGI